jgi:Protein of unknown function (DUF835)
MDAAPQVAPEPPAQEPAVEGPSPREMVSPGPPAELEEGQPLPDAEDVIPMPSPDQGVGPAQPRSGEPDELPLAPETGPLPTQPPREPQLLPSAFALPEPEPPPPPTGVELTIEDSLIASLSGFLESTAAGHHGVCVVRESPERIRARVGSRPIEVFWLTNIGRGPSLRPSDLEGAFAFLSRKLLEERVTAFFLEGIEYLVRLHGADAVLNGLVAFDRLAREHDARIWICLAPTLMKPSDLDRFRATFGRPPSPS